MQQASGTPRTLPQISQAIADACLVRDAYAHALDQALCEAQDAEEKGHGHLSYALAAGSKVAAATVQLKAAQSTLNRLLAEYQATAEGHR